MLLTRPAYKVNKHPGKYFVPGRVCLSALLEWTSIDNLEGFLNSLDGTSQCSIGSYKQRRRIRSGVWRTCILQSKKICCRSFGLAVMQRSVCYPSNLRRALLNRYSAVSTHSGRGSPQGNKNEHGIIFTGKTAPAPQNERGMQEKAIRVNPDDKGAVLDPKSRINYGKVYNIEHNVKVKNFGSLSPEYLAALIEQFMAVFTSKIRVAAVPTSTPLDRENRPDMTGKGPRSKQEFLDPGRRGAVAAHTRHVNNAAAGGRTAGSNPTGTRTQQQVREAVESDDDDDDEEDDNVVEEESSDEEENDDEEGDDDGRDDDDDYEDDDEQ